jgi:hypothetical protein
MNDLQFKDFLGKPGEHGWRMQQLFPIGPLKDQQL